VKTLELKEIAGYLPHGLKFKYFDPERECEEIIQLGEVMIEDWEDDYSHYYNGMSDYHLLPDEVTPILRPISDLYRPITHNGKEIVPIVECARISLPEHEWEFGINCAIGVIEEKIVKFKYAEGSEAFYICYYSDDAPSNQYKIFDFLHKLKIDYRGMIDDGLAIDVNTLDINPYK
jgi:hypothetical protein